MKKNYARVDGYPNLIRDLDTNAIINTDSIESSNYDRNRKIRQRKSEEIDIIKSDLVNIKSSIEEIKTLLGRIVNESWRVKTWKYVKIIWIWKNFKRIGYLHKYRSNEKYLQMLRETIFGSWRNYAKIRFIII